ncbi:MAG TPA: hypothetical protein VFS32_06130 [Candidatus Limnocylindrales bacterium]|nr:hypothetical protein [Candidatus Limnocylindrales bacterium]
MTASIQARLGRIRDAFATAVTDSRRGAEFVAARLVGLEPGSEEHDRWLAALPDAIEVVATDDERSDSAFLKLFLLSDRTVAVFFSDAHRADSASLLARLESALDDRVEVLPIGTGLSRRPARDAG